jgi:hypothetical protein
MSRPDRSRKLAWYERAFLSTMDSLSNLTIGYTLGFSEELIRQHGLQGFFKWAKHTQAATDAVFAFFGEEDGHLMASLASFWNGCDYCAYGHMLGHNIHVYAHTGKLFTIDEEEVPMLMRMRDVEVMAELRKRLAAPEYANKLRLVERKNQLRIEEGPLQTPEDKMLIKCIALYEWINECSIVADAPAPPLGPIAKNKKAWKKYLEARKAERASRPAPSNTEKIET